MKIESSVAYVESPLQLLNVIEYTQNEMIELDYLIVNYRSSITSANEKQIANVLPYLKFKRLIEIDIEPRLNQLKAVKKTIKTLTDNIGKIELFINGEYRSILANSLMCTLNPSKKLIVDDGSATLRIKRKGSSFNFQTRLLKLLYALLGVRINYNTSFDFFSVYNIRENLNVNDKLIKNSFNSIKKQMSQKKVNEAIFVIGTPIKEAGVAQFDDVKLTVNLLESLKKKYSSHELIYVPHRRERDEKLKTIGKMVTIKRFEYPFELYSLINNSRCKYLAGFYSTLFDNLNVIFGNQLQVNIFEFSVNEVNQNYKMLIQNSYSNYRNYGFNIEPIQID